MNDGGTIKRKTFFYNFPLSQKRVNIMIERKTSRKTFYFIAFPTSCLYYNIFN